MNATTTLLPLRIFCASIVFSSGFLFIPYSEAATEGGASISEVVTESQVRGEATPEPCDLSEGGCEASTHPNGPNCDPSTQFCDVGGSGGNFITRFRAEEVLQNNIAALLLGGFQLFSPYWKNYENEHQTADTSITLKAIEAKSLAKTRRGILDIVLRNLSLDELYIPGSDAINTTTLETLGTTSSPISKRTPGLLPLGYQYELTPEVTSSLDIERGKCASGDALCQAMYTPSLDHPIIPTPAYYDSYTPYGAYVVDIWTQYLSQKLKRTLRIKPQSICATTTCQTAGHLQFFLSTVPGVNYFHATTTCAMGGGRLPSSQELEVLISEGFIQASTKVYSTDFVNHVLVGSYPWQVYSIETQSSGTKVPSNVDTMVASDIRPLYCIVD